VPSRRTSLARLYSLLARVDQQHQQMLAIQTRIEQLRNEIRRLAEPVQKPDNQLIPRRKIP
jgi:cell division protein FtsB